MEEQGEAEEEGKKWKGREGVEEASEVERRNEGKGRLNNGKGGKKWE